jgi:hypothetical protein
MARRLEGRAEHGEVQGPPIVRRIHGQARLDCGAGAREVAQPREGLAVLGQGVRVLGRHREGVRVEACRRLPVPTLARRTRADEGGLEAELRIETAVGGVEVDGARRHLQCLHAIAESGADAGEGGADSRTSRIAPCGGAEQRFGSLRVSRLDELGGPQQAGRGFAVGQKGCSPFQCRRRARRIAAPLAQARRRIPHRRGPVVERERPLDALEGRVVALQLLEDLCELHLVGGGRLGGWVVAPGREHLGE